MYSWKHLPLRLRKIRCKFTIHNRHLPFTTIVTHSLALSRHTLLKDGCLRYKNVS